MAAKSQPSFSPGRRWKIGFDVVVRTALVLAVGVVLAPVCVVVAVAVVLVSGGVGAGPDADTVFVAEPHPPNSAPHATPRVNVAVRAKAARIAHIVFAARLAPPR